MDNNRLFDDLTRVAGGAFTVLSALGKQVKHTLKDQMGDNLGATSPANDDVMRLQGMVGKLRMEQEDLKKRITALESMLGKKAAPASKKPSPQKAAPKKAVPKKAVSKKTTKTKK